MGGSGSSVELGTHHTVAAGECLSSICERAGHFWETVWNHPSNADLAARRPDPNVLAPGDEVFLPALRPRLESCATRARHRFRRKGVPARLRLQFWYGGRPRAGHRCVLTVDGVERPAFDLDGEGRLDVVIPCGAREARILLGADDDAEELTLSLGQLDPADRPSGVRARLENLGLLDAEADGDDALATGVKAFQTLHGLPVSGLADDVTQAQLVAAHGS